MKPSDELFQLIKTMSPSEKRYFKLIAQSTKTTSSEKNYLLLFDLLDKQAQYNHEELREEFQKRKLNVNIASEKNYLYRHILKSLGMYQSGQTKKSKAREFLNAANTLFGKALYQQSLKQIKLLKDMAADIEDYALLYEGLMLERNILNTIMPSDYDQRLMDSEIQLNNLLDKQNVLIKLTNLKDKVFRIMSSSFHHQKDEKLRELERLMESPLLLLDKKSLGFQERLLVLQVQGFYFRVIHKLEESRNKLREVVNEWETNPEMLHEYPLAYKKAVSNYLNTSYMLGDFSEIELYIDKMKAINPRGLQEEIMDFYLIDGLTLSLYIDVKKHISKMPALKEIEAKYHKYSHNFPASRKISYSFNFASVYFINEDFKAAVKWFNTTINEGEKNIREDLQLNARLRRLICYYETNNFKHLDSLILSDKHFVKKAESKAIIESLLFKFIKKLLKVTDGGKKLELFNDLLLELEEIQKLPAKDIHGIRGVTVWAKSKVFNTSIIEIMEEEEKHD